MCKSAVDDDRYFDATVLTCKSAPAYTRHPSPRPVPRRHIHSHNTARDTPHYTTTTCSWLCTVVTRFGYLGNSSVLLFPVPRVFASLDRKRRTLFSEGAQRRLACTHLSRAFVQIHRRVYRLQIREVVRGREEGLHARFEPLEHGAHARTILWTLRPTLDRERGDRPIKRRLQELWPKPISGA